MIESEITGLEPFRHSRFPFFYFVENKRLQRSIIESFSNRSFGVEVGFGEDPTRVFVIDNTIPWLLFEPDQKKFHYGNDSLQFHWEDIDPQIEVVHPLIALKTAATSVMQERARIIVYRNLDYRDMDMVSFENLQPTQRVVFIVDETHISEMQKYEEYVRAYGYNPKSLRFRSKNLPSLTSPVLFTKDDYVLDVTK